MGARFRLAEAFGCTFGANGAIKAPLLGIRRVSPGNLVLLPLPICHGCSLLNPNAAIARRSSRGPPRETLNAKRKFPGVACEEKCPLRDWGTHAEGSRLVGTATAASIPRDNCVNRGVRAKGGAL
jgi:hypothetical protein